MRHLVLMRGPMGAGKSTWIKEKGLEQYTLSSDDIRLLFQSPVLTPDGNYGISQSNDNKVWRFLFDLLEERMERGEFTVVDATHSKTSMISRYKELASKYRYRVSVVDFSDVPLSVLLERNKQREQHKQVPEMAIRNSHLRMSTEKVPGWVNVIHYQDEEALDMALFYHPRDMSHWKKIHHIGDIHGCFTALKAYLDGELKDDELYIFIGDYLDRGIENGETLKFLISIKDKPNVILLEGNHERWIKKWAHGEEFLNRSFVTRTAPQLEAAGIRKKDARQFCRRLQQTVYYTYGNKTVLVTHGGLPRLPENLMMIATHQLIRGVGGYEDDVDKAWTLAHADEKVFQIHGHRNMWELPPYAFANSFNLEGSVESGGHLRVVTLDENGFETHEIKNNVFKIDRCVTVKAQMDMPIDELVTYLRNHSLVSEKELANNISSFNFTPKAFRDKAWDDITVRARGLFINTETNEIVARAYNKFFNINEREETQIAALRNTLQYPIEVYKKENGYLGLLGYNSQSDELVFTSKSTTEGEYALWFKELFCTLYKDKLRDIKKCLRQTNSCMVFEVMLPEKDPHIIEYDKDHVVLLDVVSRTVEFSKVNYSKLIEIAELFGFTPKKKEGEFKSWGEFYTWYRNALDDWDRKEEGFVIEDASGFCTKLKLPYYAFWKYMRALKDRVAKDHTHMVKTGSLITPLHNHFFKWLKQQDPEYLSSTSIISIRKKFLEEVPEALTA